MSTIASSVASPPAWRLNINKALAMFKRDASLDLSYDVSFWLRWLSIFMSVVIFYFISKLIPPSPQYGFGGTMARYFDYIVVNLAFLRFQATAIQCFQNAIRNDQMTGTLEVLMATPTSLSTIILSTGLWAFTLTLLQAFATLAFGALLGLDLTHINFVSTIVFILLTIMCMSPVGVMSAAGIMTFKQSGPSGFVMGNAANLLGGALFPISVLPPYLQYVSWALPITHALNGLRGAVHGGTLSQLAPDALWLLLASGILLPVSLWLFARAVRRAKIDGTLGQY
jgi:ABC-2 type transport system permease protein